MSTSEMEIFKEWAKQVFSLIEHTQSEVDQMRRGCEACRTETNRRLAALQTKVDILWAKITAAVAVIIIVIEVGVKLIK